MLREVKKHIRAAWKQHRTGRGARVAWGMLYVPVVSSMGLEPPTPPSELKTLFCRALWNWLYTEGYDKDTTLGICITS